LATARTLQDAVTARTLAFSREVRTRCVTLDGDDFNPSGTLTGAPLP
jgi:structural maintenance of chromosome 2